MQFTLCLRKAFATGLEGFSPCLRTVYAFERACLRKVVVLAFQGPFCPCLEGLLPFPSKGLQLCYRMPLPSKGLCIPRHFALVIEKICPISSKGLWLCLRRAFPSEGLCVRRAYSSGGPLSSKGLCLFLRSGLGFDSSKSLCLQRAFGEPWPLPSRGFCVESAPSFAIAFQGPFP